MEATLLKNQVIKLIQSLPDDVTLDIILEELYFRIVVEEGLKQLDAGTGIPHEEVLKKFQYV